MEQGREGGLGSKGQESIIRPNRPENSGPERTPPKKQRGKALRFYHENRCWLEFPRIILILLATSWTCFGQ